MTASLHLPSLLANRRLVLCGLALVLATRVASPAAAAETSSSASAVSAGHAEERARIVGERAAAEARYSRRERECRQRFIVTSCLDEAKVERRQVLDQLRARQLVVDEARRHERAEERRTELADKAAEDVKRERARAAHAAASGPADAASQLRRPLGPHREEGAASAASRANGEHERARSPATASGITARAREPAAVRQEREAAHRAAFEERKAEAAEHRDEAIERTTKRMAQKAPAAPLPVVGAASAVAPRAAARP